MDTRHLHEFTVLASYLNFSEAASELFISQSTLSKHMQSLEKELGSKLFIRDTRHISLSAAGNAFLPYAQRMVALLDSAQVTIDNLRDRAMADLVIGVIQNPQYYDLSKYMIRFRNTKPDVSFSLIESDESGLLDMFKRRYFNLFTAFPPTASLPGIVSPTAGRPAYHFLPMVRTKFVAVFSTTATPSNRESITLPELANQDLMLPAHGSTISDLILNAFHDEGITPRVIYEGSSSGLIDLVKAGLGVSLHSVEFAAHVESLTPDGSICSIPIEPPLYFTYGIGYRDPSELTDAERGYLQYMEQYRLME